eukprot:CAMPEP_0177429746 /NCGR_PEP_ID=MMETSP0368-20130122/75276_1 /TAXON_ID=447022 ORGANISM="Scrippsiella hangoei-like, Strain SHHI-4" /NCGR_SAMPLE_ID=MMETSP0368 /ASSEMBLY_ACC=CAM_ASM_000363 /LENGTH=87 /DNA_ID=CAMNT_0018900271 /DNA_START=236 /DNA_END=499 /DNA_ORIENTATION=-
MTSGPHLALDDATAMIWLSRKGKAAEHKMCDQTDIGTYVQALPLQSLTKQECARWLQRTIARHEKHARSRFTQSPGYSKIEIRIQTP